MALSDKAQAAIEAARQRTRKLLEEQANRGNQQSITTALPSSRTIAQKTEADRTTTETSSSESKVYDARKEFSTVILANGATFDPYDIPGVGRANEQQAEAIRRFGVNGESGCLIGPAGTGKTTTMRAAINAAVLSGRIPILSESLAHKYLKGGLPGIYGGSFTRIATRNLRNNFPADLQPNVHTLHRLLEFEPEVFDTTDPATGKQKTIRIFKPTRNRFRPFDTNLVSFWLDESSMIGYTRLHAQFIEAIPNMEITQIVYIGDIAQIPPVMDDAVLGYKMLEYIPKGSCIELKEVYRHAGAIVSLANSIRVGNTIPDNRTIIPYLGNLRKLPREKIDEWYQKDLWAKLDTHEFHKEEDGSKVTIKYWKNRLEGDVGQLKALQNLGLWNFQKNQGGFFPKEIEEGKYNPLTDMILMPYNKAVGTIELNKYLAQYLGRKREATVYEVIAGFNKHYFAVGDKIFYEREEAIITKININAMYAGRAAKTPAVTLDRWGHNTTGEVSTVSTNAPVDDIEMLLNIDIGSDDEERKNQASHVLYVKKIADLDDPNIEEDTIQTAAEINGIIFGYALTIHKSQGSQWPKVYCVFHNSHNRNLQRELLYTAITRAQKELVIIAEPETFIQGVISQHITGDTLEQKAEFFKGKLESNEKRDKLFAGNGG
jgi:ATP-dependent exoDNAse (exonuclease V) alpha subunit